MGIMSELFKSPFNGPEPGFNDGLVEPGADFDPSFAPFGPLEAIDGSTGRPVEHVDAFDTHDPSADPFGIGRDMDADAYVGEAQRLVEEFSGNNELSLEDLIRRRFYELRAELRTRPWFRIICDAKLMVDESRAAWAGRRHRALLALGLRKTPAQPCQHCFRENGTGQARNHYVGHEHHDFASPSMGGFSEEDRLSGVASAIQSMGFQVANSSYGVNRAVRAMEQAVEAMARQQHACHAQPPIPPHPRGHTTSGVVQHIPPAPFPVYQRPAGLDPIQDDLDPSMGDFAVPGLHPHDVPPTGRCNSMGDFVPNEAGLGGSVVLMGGSSAPIAAPAPDPVEDPVAPVESPMVEAPVIGAPVEEPVAPVEEAAHPPVTDTPVPLVVSEASLSVDPDELRREIAGTIKKLEQALEALKRPS